MAAGEKFKDRFVMVCGLFYLFFLSPLFDFSNLHNWSLLHERYLPIRLMIRHKTGTSSAHPDLREHGVCVRNTAFGGRASTCDCLVQTSN